MGGFSLQYCFLLLTISTVIASFPSVNCNSEGDALFTWKSKLEDPNNVLQSWDPTLINPCTWFHVTCNNDNSVVRVDLGNAGLRGPLVPELGQLSNLEYLEVYENRLSGEIPTAIGNLTKLISLDLYRNDLSGPIPYSLGLLSSLKFMRLNHNQLSGTIPPLIGNLTSLLKLHLQHNHLSGVIPSSFAHLISLNSLRLNTNNLTGVIPTSLLQLITYGHLKILDVSTNNFEGRRQSKTTNSTRVVAITTIIQDPLA